MTTTLLSIFVIAFIAYVVGTCRVALAVDQVLRPLLRGRGDLVRSVGMTLADIAKGYVVVSLAWNGGLECARVAALFVFLGHIYPIFRQFSGGNGMAVLSGALIAFDPFIGFMALVAWIFGFYVFRSASLAAFTSALATPILVVFLDADRLGDLLLVFGLAALIFWRQRDHLARYVVGTEQVIVVDKRDV